MDEAQQTQFYWAERSLEALKPGDLLNAVVIWRRLCRGSVMPEWKADVLLEIPFTLTPLTNVIDTGDGAPPFVYRYFGTALADIHAFELTGKTTDTIAPQSFKEVCVRQHLVTIQRKQPCVFLNEIPSRAGVTYTHTMVRLPFSRDGTNVTQIMTVEEHAEEAEEIKNIVSNGSPGNLIR